MKKKKMCTSFNSAVAMHSTADDVFSAAGFCLTRNTN